MEWLTENVALQIITFLVVIGGFFKLGLTWLVKHIDAQIFTKADWVAERAELKREHQDELAAMKVEHRDDIEQRVRDLVHFYEEKIAGLLASHNVEMESMRSKMRDLSAELEHWKGHFEERGEKIKQDVVKDIKSRL